MILRKASLSIQAFLTPNHQSFRDSNFIEPVFLLKLVWLRVNSWSNLALSGKFSINKIAGT